MPLPHIECDIPSEDLCCTVAFDIADLLLTGVYEGLQNCVVETPCSEHDQWLKYVTMGQGDDAVLDAISVSILSITPSAKSQASGKLAPVAAMSFAYRTRILESGWPVVYVAADGVIFPPDPTVQNALARHAYAHGEQMYRSVTHMARTNGMMPEGFACSAAIVGPLLPIPPLGGIVGFYADLTVTIGW